MRFVRTLTGKAAAATAAFAAAAAVTTLGATAGGLPAASAADPPSPVIAAAGDIACAAGKVRTSSTCHAADTAKLLAAGNYAAVLPLGDDQYECGRLTDFTNIYGRTWGAFKSVSRPIAGDNEYEGDTCTSYGANGYFTYFGARANDAAQASCTSACRGYYSYNLGSWHVIALNSECSKPGVGGCSSGSPQAKWLEADLKAHPNSCTLAYWHKPRWANGSRSSTAHFVYQLYKGGADVVLGGHAHLYERYAPQNYRDAADSAYGLRQFVVGTGGRSHSSYKTPLPNLQVRNNTAYGVLALTLNPGSYSWKFVPEAGATFTDSGTTACHGKPPA